MVFCFCDEFKFFLIATRIFLTEIMSLLYIQNPFGSCNRARCQLTAWPRCNLLAEKFLRHFPHPHSLLEKKKLRRAFGRRLDGGKTGCAVSSYKPRDPL
ncbi:hypothetical protein C0J52_13754 [Blattella germanica]|nr:hypothetical protein C0J52_13754 [Blattella germanica]